MAIQQYNPALFITIFPFLSSRLFNLSPIYIALPQFHSVRFLLYFQISFSQSWTYTHAESHPHAFISFDYYCYLYDFAALLKIECKHIYTHARAHWVYLQWGWDVKILLCYFGKGIKSIHSQVAAFVRRITCCMHPLTFNHPHPRLLPQLSTLSSAF
jgi:hypothetical protein